MIHPACAGIVFVLAAMAAVAATVNEWTPAGTKGGVAVAFRDDPALDAREVRATAELPFAASSIFGTVCDFTHYRTTIPGVQEARRLSGSAPADYEIYLRYSPRFVVVAARDVVVRVQGAARDDGGFACTWSEVTGRVDQARGVVRMPLLRGSWTIERLGEGRSRVIYQVAARPGGRLPGWMVRRGAVSALPEVIEQVRKCLERQRPPTGARAEPCPA